LLGNNQSISIAGKLTTGATYTTGNYKITFEEVLCGGATGRDRVRMRIENDVLFLVKHV
jgi:hypothetical protein